MASVRIKICGITTVANALRAAALDIDAIGLNFCPASKRLVDVEVAKDIIDALPPFVEPVALYVNETLEQASSHAWHLGKVRTIQWHGDDPQVHPANAWYRYIPAFPILDAGSLGRVTGFLERCRATGRIPAAILLDGHASGLYGGTGQTAPWEMLAGFHPGVPVILAGGLTADNVAEAIRIVRPFAVDVASGVESKPGRKDPEKLKRFVDAVRAC
jgi:phosphoribosylanthranilate isomerase